MQTNMKKTVFVLLPLLLSIENISAHFRQHVRNDNSENVKFSNELDNKENVVIPPGEYLILSAEKGTDRYGKSLAIGSQGKGLGRAAKDVAKFFLFPVLFLTLIPPLTGLILALYASGIIFAMPIQYLLNLNSLFLQDKHTIWTVAAPNEGIDNFGKHAFDEASISNGFVLEKTVKIKNSSMTVKMDKAVAKLNQKQHGRHRNMNADNMIAKRAEDFGKDHFDDPNLSHYFVYLKLLPSESSKFRHSKWLKASYNDQVRLNVNDMSAWKLIRVDSLSPSRQAEVRLNNN